MYITTFPRHRIPSPLLGAPPGPVDAQPRVRGDADAAAAAAADRGGRGADWRGHHA